MLIGLMSLPNQVVYVQFHPVAYMVKLNIEMSMASLIVHVARGHTSDGDPYGNSHNAYFHSQHRPATFSPAGRDDVKDRNSEDGIRRHTDFEVRRDVRSGSDEVSMKGNLGGMQTATKCIVNAGSGSDVYRPYISDDVPLNESRMEIPAARMSRMY